MLTKKQLKEIEEAIKRRFLSFTYEAFGEDALTEEEIKKLKSAGLIRDNVRNFTGDSYSLGKVISILGADAASLSFSDAMRRIKEMDIPTTKVEKEAIKWSSVHSGQYIKGIGDDISKELGALTSRVAQRALRMAREEVSEAIRERTTTGELKSELYSLMKEKYKDWQRVASTEMHESIQRGLHSEIVKNHGKDQLVYKLPESNACAHCKRLFLESDGVTPRVFRASDLQDTNFGLKAQDWQPVIGAVHPWCQCQLMIVPEGFSFVKNPKTGAVRLEFTGETALVSTKKSLYSDMDDNCICSY